MLTNDNNYKRDHLMANTFQRLDYDSSSGVASSATSSSLSSIYQEFSSWNLPPPPRVTKHFPEANRNMNSNSIYDKVLMWIKNTEKCAVNEIPELGITSLPSSLPGNNNNWPRTSSVNNNILNSFVNTDSTSKTDQSNFTYFI